VTAACGAGRDCGRCLRSVRAIIAAQRDCADAVVPR
jgi:bacterioferritin-associated ferredoxin